MDVVDTLVAVLAVLVGFGAGYAFRGWYAKRTQGEQTPPEQRPEP